MREVLFPRLIKLRADDALAQGLADAVPGQVLGTGAGLAVFGYPYP